ncbi:MAG TPA: class I lanthipeptide [Chitinophaga sp.]|uniref:class I lanthipeptide n=1 Tax=Chitinophaga sp. TaxID=1869181 RepID=UPI002C9045E2|nr:class I lanthipeptide [Chitinophaga sp.]HVI47253.1 class I lanthipeptide [Chitinophaga sp.]
MKRKKLSLSKKLQLNKNMIASLTEDLQSRVNGGLATQTRCTTDGRLTLCPTDCFINTRRC